jgi:PRC-barrel domain
VTAPIEDVSSLPGRKVKDQEENPIGKIQEIYAIDGDGDPMWVSLEGSFGSGKRTVLIPIARLKDEGGDLLVPYSRNHIGDAPEVDGSDGISAEDDRKLRDFFGIGIGDQELRSDNKSYATRVPDEGSEAQRVDDPESLELPDADTRTDETKERLEESQRRESRGVDGLTGDDDEGDDDEGDDQAADEDRESDSGD